MMRRTDKEIDDRAEIDAVIRGADVCRLGLIVEGEPYVVPVSYGYDGRSLYVHTASTGRKLAGMAPGTRVCFEVERNVRLVTDEHDPCRWTFTFETVIGWGRIAEIVGDDQRRAALDHIMEHYSGRSWPRESFRLAAVRVWGIDIDTVTGKRSPGKAPADG